MAKADIRVAPLPPEEVKVVERISAKRLLSDQPSAPASAEPDFYTTTLAEEENEPETS